ncbi:DUF5103 domain-containing protein [Parabacteroides bouchesdurhonensis]|uniref:type IX secretion system plug protein n=1 Tax=Parabacteroides bouchesdurhonensis TaxID=1936995 RepID=UPI000C833942|nr:DUF5103 domain-containing protein [Parabacteroides bouchesdurhonensis]
MKAFNTLILLFCFIAVPVNAQQTTYYTNVSSKQIKTLQVKVAGEMFSNPCIVLNGDDRIEINFDALNEGGVRYAYSLIHCNADWTKSILSPIEYMNGFQGMTIDDFANSMGTTVQYTNYRLLIPNEDVQPKVSGNYAMTVYKEDNPGEIVFTACFSLVEPMVGLSASVSGNTDIDTNQSHQQVSFTINNKNFPIPYPQTDLKLWVYQDNRRDNAVTGLQPMSILENQITYANNRNLIFEAGNEYRRMEFLSNKYNGMHIESISFHNPYYNVELMTDYKRNSESYQYDQDQDGRFFIRCSNCNDPDTEADYYIVHFTQACDLLPNGNLYLNGELYNNVLDEKSKMSYNPETNCYEKAVLLKQGSYNYQYLFVPNGQTAGETGPVEGNFYQTENEYTIYVYYKPMGARYDRLIGFTSVKNAMQIFN